MLAGIKRLLFQRKRACEPGFFDTFSAGITAQEFDPAWYLKTYPDVAAAGVSPWLHFLQRGRKEARIPSANRAVAFDYHLWRGGEAMMLPRLERLAVDTESASAERYRAAWALGRWFASEGNWTQAVSWLEGAIAEAESAPGYPGPWLLYVAALQHCDRSAEAEKVLQCAMSRFSNCADFDLLRIGGMEQAQRVSALGRLYSSLGVTTVVDNVVDGEVRGLQSLAAGARENAAPGKNAPLLSVVIPACNNEGQAEQDLRGILRQTWPNMEIIVVDDGSCEASRAGLERLVTEMAGQTAAPIRLYRHDGARGKYAACNTGLEQAKGAFVTFLEPGDWSHPRRFELQIHAILGQKSSIGSVCHSTLATADLAFGYGWLEDTWIRSDPSSLMFRRSAVSRIGYLDPVKSGGYREYLERILCRYGEASVEAVLAKVPLLLRQVSDAPSRSDLVPPLRGHRKSYLEASRQWHRDGGLYMGAEIDSRPFPAPAEMCIGDGANQSGCLKDRVRQSGYFDYLWYLEQYPDLQGTVTDLFDHFWDVGSAEGRDPGPGFSTSGYFYRYPAAKEIGLPALGHYISVGRSSGVEALAGTEGVREWRSDTPTLVVCAHQAGEYLYGAERSLVDVLRGLCKLGVNLVAVVPCAVNREYLEVLREYVQILEVVPYRWWNASRGSCQETVDHFSRILVQYSASALYANTLVLDEPLLAARALHVPAVVHVRELPAQDEALCTALGSGAPELVQRVRQLADILVVNSAFVAQSFSAESAIVVPNIVDVDSFADLPRRCGPDVESRVVRVGMLSSNLPKKGLADFVAVAARLQLSGAKLEFWLFGPDTQLIRELRERVSVGDLPTNLVFAGYVGSPQDALGSLDIVVNFSRFQESFGRTVLEAMAAGLPVVAYDWGAIPELVENGVTGFLAPYGNVDVAADCVMTLVETEKLRQRMGEAGRQRVQVAFGEANLVASLRQVLEQLAPGVD
ncbi:glycosyltransferase [Microbulbifer bruguierae]|uniref:Glycosyltransferase n=1 Tax=Microbulbifer bruguierae TaxID=3029061 RepID=A0ABY8NFX7_9GAMM|nr:glycosyltransferase [Microbulbifer bruguierae]WGL16398.1 glycosyltransferase [Microbulbifer bruguierae]